VRKERKEGSLHGVLFPILVVIVSFVIIFVVSPWWEAYTAPKGLVELVGSQNSYYVKEYYIDNANWVHFDSYWEYSYLRNKWVEVNEGVTIYELIETKEVQN